MMTKRKQVRRDPQEAAIERGLRPGRFVNYRVEWDFVSELEEIAAQIDQLARTDANRAVRLYDSFLAGCYEKADDIDGSSGKFGMFVERLYVGWLKTR
jgi:hypothetical protein